MFTIGFDNEKYLSLQSEHIKNRVQKFNNKLYLEFGGKLFDDYHASRVLPGFEIDSKIKLLEKLKDKLEIVIVVNADDIENNKIRSDLGITYDEDVLRLIDAFRFRNLYVGSVVINKYSGQKSSVRFKQYIEEFGIKVYIHYLIVDYPSNIEVVLSEDGYGKNEYIETVKPLIVVTAPGPGSGKMAVCLSQLYNDYIRGIKAGYAKFETFPVWNLPLNHPINLAYESATIDLNDINMIDPFHLEFYGINSVNYNRDIEIFPVLRSIFEKIYSKSEYNSPTDMGVNMVGHCISDEEVCKIASKQEIIRRYYNLKCDIKRGKSNGGIKKIEILLNKAGIDCNEREVVERAYRKYLKTGINSVAIELPNGVIVVGKSSSVVNAASAALLNAIKELAKLEDSLHLISPNVLQPIKLLKENLLKNSDSSLNLNETLIALSMCTATDKKAKLALEQIPQLKNSEAHSVFILSQVDIETFKNLGVNITCEAQYENNNLYHK